MTDKLIKLLKNNARLSVAELAVMLGVSEERVEQELRDLEQRGVIRGYSAIVDDDIYDPDTVTALIELNVTPQSQSGYDEIARSIAAFDQVDSVRLMSGTYDILVSVTGRNIRDVSHFVAENLATIDAVQSTATHFVLKVYKANGIIVSGSGEDERSMISP